MDALLRKHKELERHQIFLARSNELNDPMEGYKDVVWQGDAVLWENLLRHYVLALLTVNMQCVLMGNDGAFEEPRIPAALTQDDLPTDAFRVLYNDACHDFFNRPGPSSLCARLTALRNPLRREGIRFVLSLIHAEAFAAVTSLLVARGLINSEAAKVLPKSTALDAVFKPFTDESQVPNVDLETIALIANRTREDLALRSLFERENTGANAAARKAMFLAFTFPDRYVHGVVEGLVYPEWRTACFSKTCTNASSWAAYAQEHTGAALVFRPRVENGQPYLPLTGVIGTSGGVGQPSRKIRGPIKGGLAAVTYSNRPPEVDFFQSLGTLPRPKLERAWHCNREGTRSPVIDAALKDDTAWRAAYWASFNRIATTKLEDWKHEEEYRIVLSDFLGLHAQSADALVEYDFSCLVGVVFGLRTGEHDKLEVMKLIAADCARTGRKDFEFHHVLYQPSKGCLVRV